MTTLPRLERWCFSCFGFVPLSTDDRCLHCGNPCPDMPRTTLHRDAKRLQWHEVIDRKGPGRKQRLIGSQLYSLSTEADLWAQAQTLSAQGYIVTITPAAPSVVDADSYAPDPGDCVLDITPR